MSKIKKICFYKYNDKTRCLIYLDYNNCLDLDINSGIYKFREYISQHLNEDENYNIFDDPNLYIRNNAFYDSKRFLKDEYENCLANRIIGSEIESISFKKEEDNAYKLPIATITYKYVYKDKNNIKYVKTKVDLSESIDEIIAYCKRNNITNIEDIFNENGICSIDPNFQLFFLKEVIPDLNDIISKIEKNNDEDNKVSDIIKHNKSNIGRIVLYKDDNGIEDAMIFYRNGKIKRVSKDKGMSIIIKYSEDNNESIDNIVDSKFAIRTTKQELYENIFKYQDDVVKQKNKKSLNHKKYFKTIIAILLAAGVGFGVGESISKIANKENNLDNLNINNTINQEQEYIYKK